MATFRTTIYNLIRASLMAGIDGGTSDATKATINDLSNELADAVANAVHDDLVDKVDDLGKATKAFAQALAGCTIVPGDGGASIKAATVSACTQIVAAANALTSAIGSYK